MAIGIVEVGIIVAGIAVVAYFINESRKNKKEADELRNRPPSGSHDGEDGDEEEDEESEE